MRLVFWDVSHARYKAFSPILPLWNKRSTRVSSRNIGSDEVSAQSALQFARGTPRCRDLSNVKVCTPLDIIGCTLVLTQRMARVALWLMLRLYNIAVKILDAPLVWGMG